MTLDDFEAKKAKQNEITLLQLSLEEQKNRKGLATLEVERLQEGATNSAALQTLAEEIASAKDKTDTIVQTLKAAKTTLQKEITQLETNLTDLEELIEGLQYRISNETDEV